MEKTKNKILIVDDSELNRALLADMLSDSFDIVEADNGMKALAILHERGMDIALVLLDIVMPVMDGFEVLSVMNKNGWIDSIPVIIISSETGGACIDRAYDLGAIDYISRPFDERTVKHRVMSNFMLSIKQHDMHRMLSEKIYEKEKDNSLMIEILSNIVEFRNGESGLHVLHVHVITELLLNRLVEKTDKYGLTPQDIHIIGTASALHDIGKISIASEILNKPGRLTDEEFEIMKTHAIEGAKILDGIPTVNREKLIDISRDICRWHHERYDGSGYPDGLVGDEIPIAAQAVSIADVYDALISRRSYKPAYTSEQAIKMIKDGECGVFNPILIECLDDISDKLKSELTIISYGHATEAGIKNAVKQTLKSDGTNVSRRMVRQIEHERMKYRFLADITHEITFEYVASPEMIKLSDWSAESLGVPVVILDPLENEAWCSIFKREDFMHWLNSIHSTTPQNPVVTDKYLLNLGGEKWAMVVAKALWSEDDEKPEFEGAVCRIIDVNDATMTIKKLRYAAQLDPFTGLYNRAAAKEYIQKTLCACENKKYVFIIIDLDNFKQANDKRGHLFGDLILRTVASRIKENIRSDDIAARIGGDEFLLFMEHKEAVESQVKRIFGKLCEPYEDFDIRMSMGVALTDDLNREVDDVFKMADAAMYAVKNGGKCGYKFYEQGMKSILDSDKE